MWPCNPPAAVLAVGPPDSRLEDGVARRKKFTRSLEFSSLRLQPRGRKKLSAASF